MDLQPKTMSLKIFLILFFFNWIFGVYLIWLSSQEPPKMQVIAEEVTHTARYRQFEWIKIGPWSLNNFKSNSVGVLMEVIDVKQEASIPLTFERKPKNISVYVLNSGEEISFLDNPLKLKLPPLSPGVYKIVVNGEWFEGEATYWFKVRVSE
jgi:hypothetical protein